jgi:hypothetical protein
MADDSLDSQVGARICNGLRIMRACLESTTLINEQFGHSRTVLKQCTGIVFPTTPIRPRLAANVNRLQTDPAA